MRSCYGALAVRGRNAQQPARPEGQAGPRRSGAQHEQTVAAEAGQTSVDIFPTAARCFGVLAAALLPSALQPRSSAIAAPALPKLSSSARCAAAQRRIRVSHCVSGSSRVSPCLCTTPIACDDACSARRSARVTVSACQAPRARLTSPSILLLGMAMGNKASLRAAVELGGDAQPGLSCIGATRSATAAKARAIKGAP